MDRSATDPIAVLGDDVFLLVLDYLAPADLVAVDSVSQPWRDFIVRQHDVWRRICRSNGIDVREHRHAEAERAAISRDEQYSGELSEESPGDFRRAWAWKERHMYETIVKAPAFKTRSIYMDHDEDYIYALTETSMSSRHECLLVLNKYTGQLLQRIPWITPHANISVGAGYVAVSQYQRDSLRDRRREYSWLGTVTVFRTATAAARANAPWRDRGPLEFACEFADKEVTHSDVMAVRMVGGKGLFVAASNSAAHLVDLDSGRRTSIALANVSTIDSPLLGDRDMKDKEAKVWSVNVTEEHLFVVTQYQVHIFTHMGEKVVVYPDPCDDYLTHTGLAYHVEGQYPYDNEYAISPETPQSAPAGFGVAWTLQWEITGSHPDSHEFSEAVETGFGYPSEWDDGHSDDSPNWYLQDRFQLDGMNPWLQDVSFTTDDMVIRGRQGAIFIVRNYRRVLHEVLDIKEARERIAYIGRHTLVIGFDEPVDVVACHGNRVAFHSTDTILMVLDTEQLPAMPWNGGPDTSVSATAYAFEVSSLEGMHEESSVVMDSRAVYMADWEKGMPDNSIDYSSLHSMYQDDEGWAFMIPPNWGCIKVWTMRPKAALLHRPYAKALAQVKLDDCQQSCGRVFHLPLTPAPDWQDFLDGVAGMVGEDVTWRLDGETDAYDDATDREEDEQAEGEAGSENDGNDGDEDGGDNDEEGGGNDDGGAGGEE